MVRSFLDTAAAVQEEAMTWSQEIDLVAERRVQLPTHGKWVDVPGSPFQIMTHDADPVGIMHVRIRPSYAAYWNEFMSDKEVGN